MKAIKTAVKTARKNRKTKILSYLDVMEVNPNLDIEAVKEYMWANLSDFEISCGCIQQKIRDKSYVKMYKENGIFHVQLYTETAEIKYDWLTFDTLKEARQAFKLLAKVI